MPSLEESFAKACQDRIIPGAVVLAENKDGSFRYAKAFGSSLSPEGQSADKPLQMDTLFAIASCTKLMTSIAALQCVERGLVKLDADVASILPELAALEILVSINTKGKAKTRKRKNAITLRQLLTHTSGLSYDFVSPKLMQYRKSRGETIGGKSGSVVETYSLPLLYEPGTSWGYSCAIDWAGLLVERITGKSLEQYMTENLWAPLGIKDITFWPNARPELKARMSSMSVRDPKGSGKVVHFAGRGFSDGATACMGGGGAYATMPEYMKILKSLLVDDEKLLKRETCAAMFSPQLPSAGVRFMDSLRDRANVWAMFVGYFPRRIGLDWGLGGILTTHADAGWRGKHTMMWSGLPNLFWFIDREAGICGIYGGQVMPPGDPQTNEMITVFEKAMYQRMLESKPKL